MHGVGKQGATPGREEGQFALGKGVKEGALWVLRLTVGERERVEKCISLLGKGEGSYGTWAVQNVERTYLRKYLFEH